jgi:UDP-GlcNAc:undecaprenyl-phosphate/decaprenyl-phosphate GlcNAc-1-phosphate transferase
MGLLGAVIAAAATAGLERAAAKLPKESRAPFERTNHRGETVTLLEGPIAVLGALAGVAAGRSDGRVKAAALLAGSVSGAVGAYDDLAGATDTKGFRGHLTALRRGEVTSGAVKILGVGAAGLAAAALLPRRSKGFGAVVEIVADGALIAGTANLANLLDLRPGRALKGITALSAPVVLGGGPAAAVVGAAVASAPSDLGERSMLGDCGANGLGAITGTALASALPRPLKVLALGAVVALNLASEKVSFTKVIANTPVLDKIDQWGRRPR